MLMIQLHVKWQIEYTLQWILMKKLVMKSFV